MTALEVLAAIHTHMITSRYGVPLLVAHRHGLIVETTDGQPHQVRGPLSYSLAKIGAIHMAEVMAGQMEWQKVPDIMAVAVTPGFLRAEEVLEKVGLAEANGKGGAKVDANFIASKSPF